MTGKLTCIFYTLTLVMAGSVAMAQTTPEIEKKSLNLAVPGTFENIVKAAIRLNVFDLNDDAFIDDYAKMEFCDLYRKYRADEFDWRRVRSAMRKKIQMQMQDFSTMLYLDRMEVFTNYDFRTGILNLAQQSTMHRTSLIKLTPTDTHEKFCGDALDVIPNDIIGSMDEPIQVEGIELSEQDARAVVSQLSTSVISMDKGIVMRQAYGRFTISLLGVRHYLPGKSIEMVAHLDNITFAADKEFQHPFWSGVTAIREDSPLDFGVSTSRIPFKGVNGPAASPSDDKQSQPQPAAQPPGNKQQ